MSKTFEIGDYVTADPKSDPGLFEGETFKIVEFKRNLINVPVVKVTRLDGKLTTVFYPHELSWEDGSRPASL